MGGGERRRRGRRRRRRRRRRKAPHLRRGVWGRSSPPKKGGLGGFDPKFKYNGGGDEVRVSRLD